MSFYLSFSGDSCLEASEGAAFQDVMDVEGQTCRANLVGLQPAHPYQIRISATNREGTSPFSSIG